MKTRIVKSNDKIYFKTSQSLKILDVLEFNCDFNQGKAIIQLIDLPSEDKIDPYLDNRSISNNDFVIDVAPDLLMECQFSLPYRCWLPHGEDDRNPVTNQTGNAVLVQYEGLNNLITSEPKSFPLDIFTRRKFVMNSFFPVVNIVSGTNGSGKTSLLKKLACQEASIRPTIIICETSMVPQFKDIAIATFTFGRNIFHPKIASPLHFPENEFDSAVNALFRDFPFSQNMKSRMRSILLKTYPSEHFLGKQEFSNLQTVVDPKDEALKSRFGQLSTYIGEPSISLDFINDMGNYNRPVIVSFDTPELGNLLLKCLNSIKNIYMSVLIDEAQHFLQNGLQSGIDFLVKRHNFVFLTIATNQFANLPRDCIQSGSNFFLGNGVDFPRYSDTKLRTELNRLEEVYNILTKHNLLSNHRFLLWGLFTNNIFFIGQVNQDFQVLNSNPFLNKDHIVKFEKFGVFKQFTTGDHFLNIEVVNESTNIRESITITGKNQEEVEKKLESLNLDKVTIGDSLIFTNLLKTKYIRRNGPVFRVIKSTKMRIYNESHLH